jgi:hypothetical protein
MQGAKKVGCAPRLVLADDDCKRLFRRRRASSNASRGRTVWQHLTPCNSSSHSSQSALPPEYAPGIAAALTAPRKPEAFKIYRIARLL